MEANRFELHYYLVNESHSIDALIRNKCEAEILGAVFEIANQLGILTSIETEAHIEGGLREVWRFIGKNHLHLTVLIATATLVFSRYPVKDSELQALEREHKRLEIEKTRLEIEELRKRLMTTESVDVSESAAAAAEIAAKNPRVHVRRSNYYRQLINYPKVEKIGFAVGQRFFSQEFVVDRRDFYRFIMRSDKLPPEVDENAVIEIFAPVLAEGSYHWRGQYKGKPISFAMLDSAFKAAILARKVQFQHGSQIRCVLNIYRKLDEVGEIVVTGCSVSTVLDVSEDGVTFSETSQGRALRQARSLLASQQDIFGGNDHSA